MQRRASRWRRPSTQQGHERRSGPEWPCGVEGSGAVLPSECNGKAPRRARLPMEREGKAADGAAARGRCEARRRDMQSPSTQQGNAKRRGPVWPCEDKAERGGVAVRGGRCNVRRKGAKGRAGQSDRAGRKERGDAADGGNGKAERRCGRSRREGQCDHARIKQSRAVAMRGGRCNAGRRGGGARAHSKGAKGREGQSDRAGREEPDGNAAEGRCC